MPYTLTLPSLQASLDRLRETQSLTLASKQIEHLFGVMDDSRIARVKRFARGHHCIVAYSDDCAIFHKLPVSKAPVPAALS